MKDVVFPPAAATDWECAAEVTLPNGGRADVAGTKNGVVGYVVEVLKTSRTESRTEPWCELLALEVNYELVESKIGRLNIFMTDRRRHVCDSCQVQEVERERKRNQALDVDRKITEGFTEARKEAWIFMYYYVLLDGTDLIWKDPVQLPQRILKRFSEWPDEKVAIWALKAEETADEEEVKAIPKFIRTFPIRGHPVPTKQHKALCYQTGYDPKQTCPQCRAHTNPQDLVRWWRCTRCNQDKEKCPDCDGKTSSQQLTDHGRCYQCYVKELARV